MIVGGIGALVVLAHTVLGYPPLLAERSPHPAMFYVTLGVGGVGYLLVALGLTGAVQRTSALASVAAAFACLTVVALVLGNTVIPEIGGDAGQVLRFVALFMPPVAWVVIGVWGLAASGQAGGLALAAGLLALIGGLTWMVMLLMTGGGGGGDGDGDVLPVLTHAAFGARSVAALLLALAFFTSLKAAPLRR